MSGYVPNPDDATQPTTDKIAETAAAEFRALKNKVNNIAGGAGISTGSGIQNMLTNPLLAIQLNQTVTPPRPLPEGAVNYFADCWYENHVMGVANIFDIIPTYAATAADRPPGNNNYTRIKLNNSLGGPAAGQFAYIGQGVEINNVQHLGYGSANARPTTALLTLRCSVANLLLGGSIRAENNNLFNRTYVFPIQLGAANTWQRIAVNIPGDLTPSNVWSPADTSRAVAQFGITLAAGTSLRTATPNQWIAGNAIGQVGGANFTQQVVNSTLDIGSIEWRPGTLTSANPFEIVPTALEVQNCYRYFYSQSVYLQPGAVVENVPFPTFMLRVPTVTRFVGPADTEVISVDNRGAQLRSAIGGFCFFLFDGQIA